MLLGPLFRVEMVTVARRRRYFFLRVVYGAFALFMLWSAYSSLHYLNYSGNQNISIRQGAELASTFFFSFSWLQTLAILIVGPAMAVGTIATERERRTIEYLFATDLSNAEIVLGKLLARLCMLAKLLLVGLPILFLFRLLGGIPAKLLVATFIFAGSNALLIISISVCVSVWSERSRDATVRVYLLLAALLILPGIFYGLGASNWGIFGTSVWQALAQPAVEFCTNVNPIWALGNSFGSRVALGAGLELSFVGETVLKQCLVSFAAIALAIMAVRRVHLSETSKAAAKKREWQWRSTKSRKLIGNNPMIWKEMFSRVASTKLGIAGRVAITLLLVTIFGFTIYAYIESFRGFWGSRSFFGFIMGVTYFLGTGILLLMAARAAGLMTSEKERDCWLSLISTPLAGHEIIRGKLWGNLYHARWSMIVLLVLWGVGVLREPSYVGAMVASVATFLLYALYVTNLGLYFSLVSQTTLRAMGSTLGTLLFTGGGYMFCCCMIMVGSRSSDEGLLALFLAPCIPFQIAAPSQFYLEAMRDYSYVEGEFIVAYVLGTIGYLFVSVILYRALVRNFDRFAGRVEEDFTKSSKYGRQLGPNVAEV